MDFFLHGLKHGLNKMYGHYSTLYLPLHPYLCSSFCFGSSISIILSAFLSLHSACYFVFTESFQVLLLNSK